MQEKERSYEYDQIVEDESTIEESMTLGPVLDAIIEATERRRRRIVCDYCKRPDCLNSFDLEE